MQRCAKPLQDVFCRTGNFDVRRPEAFSLPKHTYHPLKASSNNSGKPRHQTASPGVLLQGDAGCILQLFAIVILDGLGQAEDNLSQFEPATFQVTRGQRYAGRCPPLKNSRNQLRVWRASTFIIWGNTPECLTSVHMAFSLLV
jgi:hypothetical protein